jgi:hypothetical protein
LVLVKQILKAINDKGNMDKFALYLQTDNDKTLDRLTFLSEHGYVQINETNEFSLTGRGSQLLIKI